MRRIDVYDVVEAIPSALSRLVLEVVVPSHGDTYGYEDLAQLVVERTPER